MLLVGIRAANIPNQEETAILLQFIYKKYEGLTLGEIGLAFEKAVAGELELETASCFENFSTEYFGKIMAAYKKWSSRIYSENQLYVVKPQTTNLIEMKADFSELAEIYYQDYLNNRFNIRIMPAEIYGACMNYGYMAADAYEDWLGKALNLIKLTTPESYKEEQDKSEIIKTGFEHFKVVELAKKLSVEFLYKKAQEQKMKNLFVK